MIVQPDFLTHWKVVALAARIGRLEALTALLALWGHCQTRRCWVFDANPAMMAGICQYPSGNPRDFTDALLELNLLDVAADGRWEVHDWATSNASLLHNWKVGATGGRPKKGPQKNPDETLGKPGENPRVTPGEPEGEPIREEKRREEKKKDPPTPFSGGVVTGEVSPDNPLNPDLGSETQKKEGTAARGAVDLFEAKKRRRAGREVPAWAVAIYDAYPRKVARAAALKAIVAAAANYSLKPADLLGKVEMYAVAVAKWSAEDRQFVPHPATWFNQGRYADDPQEWVRTRPLAEFAEKKEGAAGVVVSEAEELEPVGWREAWPNVFDSPCPGAWAALPVSAQASVRQWLEGQH